MTGYSAFRLESDVKKGGNNGLKSTRFNKYRFILYKKRI